MKAMHVAGVALLTMACHLWTANACAHPGAGIEVDEEGQVYFQDSLARTIWKIDTQGKLTEFHLGIGGHWMCLDADGSFSRTQPKFYFGRITPSGAKPALIVADGGAPIAVCKDGNLYYGSGINGRETMAPGGLTVTRMSRGGVRTNFSPQLQQFFEQRKDGVTGLAPGPDGSLYVACDKGVLKVAMDGAVSVVAHPLIVSECDVDGDGASGNPRLRGLAVDSDGTVYVAASGCRCIMRIMPADEATTLLKAQQPWSPTGVAVHDHEIYVLEYTYANGGPGDGWTPRVRKMTRDGRVTTLATLSPDRVIGKSQ